MHPKHESDTNYVRNRKAALCFFLIVIAMVAIYIAMPLPDSFREIHPEEQILRGPIEEIREYVLNDTPIGMDMDEVLKVIEGHSEWVLFQISYEHGPDYGTGVGEKSIRVHMGEYKEPGFLKGITGVVVWWAFNENAELIDIFVRKDTDSL